MFIKTLALIAHDNKKKELTDWAVKNISKLSNYKLCGTGATAKMIEEATGLKVEHFLPGPYGGDQQIGSAVAEGKVDAVLFFWDPLTAQPHDPDVKALLRITVLYNTPIAMNVSTADALINSI
ncbi:MAG: methylglyoxal synthase [Clostridia bacterium]|nr:methylglyoxal synthase [Clostridia bacterium]